MSSISPDSVLKLFCQDVLIDIRKLAFQFGVDAANTMLVAALGNLERNGKIRRIGGKGRHTRFVLATFEG